MKSLKVLLSFILRVLCSGIGGRAGQGARGLASAARDATQSMARKESETRDAALGETGPTLSTVKLLSTKRFA